MKITKVWCSIAWQWGCTGVWDWHRVFVMAF